MSSIMKTLSDAVQLQQQGCGIGFNFSTLRPAGFETKRSRGLASGPISFMRMYNECFLTIKQQGRSGANMGMLDITHPDIWSFISCKDEEGLFSTFNISVVVTDMFMQRVKNTPNHQFMCNFDGLAYSPRKITTVRDKFGLVEKVEELELTYKQVFDRVCEYAHKNGEPGIMFVDQVNKDNPLPGMGRITASNPCGEQMLHPGDNCNLGSINVAAHYNIEDRFINWDLLQDTVYTAVEMLDNTIDLFDHSIELINETAKNNRRIGLGIMGFADLLFKLNVRYGGNESLYIADKLMSFINDKGFEASKELAQKRGSFPNIGKSIYGEGFALDGALVRNCAITTIAPTGSISMLCDVNGGIEPYFDLVYTKSTRSGELTYVPKAFEEAITIHYPNVNFNQLVVGLRKGNLIYDLDGRNFPENNTPFVSSMDVSPMEHVDMQSVFQKNIDNSISKTINLPNDATPDNVRDIYLTAFESGCKSITVYRDGSRKDQIIEKVESGLKDRGIDAEVGITYEDFSDLPSAEEMARRFRNKPVEVDKTQTIEKHHQELREQGLEHLIISENGEHHHVTPRPKSVQGITEKVVTARGNAYITINCWDYNGETKPFEVFVAIGKEGGELHSDMSAVTRMITLALRYGVPVESVIKHLQNIGASTCWDDGVRNEGPVDAISQVLQNVINRLEITLEKNEDDLDHLENAMQEAANLSNCPRCGMYSLVHQEGCTKCRECNYSSC